MIFQYGAHEVIEIHEVLTNSINGINLFQLYRSHLRERELQDILERQLYFMDKEYNNMVQMTTGQGLSSAVPYHQINISEPIYGLRNPIAHTPNYSVNQLTDKDIASGMLSFHKASSVSRRTASLECADPRLRRMIQLGSNNCAEMAYEIWQYMNQEGYYQVPTLEDTTTRVYLNTYKQSNNLDNAVQYR